MAKNQSLLAGALLLFIIFVAFTVFVGLSFASKADTSTTIYLQKLIPHLFDAPFSFLSFFGSFEITSAALIAIVVTKYGKNLKPAMYIFSAFLIGTVVELSGKLYLFHPSPPKLFFRNIGIFFPTTYVHTNYSYPSGHMFRTTFIVILLIFLLLKSKNPVYIISLLVIFLFFMAMSRIYLGEHWLSDVIGGMLLGAFFSVFLMRILKWAKYQKSS